MRPWRILYGKNCIGCFRRRLRPLFTGTVVAAHLEARGHCVTIASYGHNLRQLTPEGIGDFLYRLPAYETRLAAYTGSDSRALLGMLERLLENDVDLARTLHQRRAE